MRPRVDYGRPSDELAGGLAAGVARKVSQLAIAVVTSALLDLQSRGAWFGRG